MAKNAPNATEPDAEVAPVGKGRPTPTRREKEEARKRPLVIADRAEARRQSATERERQRVGMANGDEKFMPARDRGPQKRFVRDYVDARWSVGEGLIPVMVIVLILSVIKGNAVIQTSALLLLYIFFAAAIIDAVILGTRLNRRLTDKYGDKVEKVRWYATIRSFQLRPMRLPKSKVRRGQFPTL